MLDVQESALSRMQASVGYLWSKLVLENEQTLNDELSKCIGSGYEFLGVPIYKHDTQSISSPNINDLMIPYKKISRCILGILFPQFKSEVLEYNGISYDGRVEQHLQLLKNELDYALYLGLPAVLTFVISNSTLPVNFGAFLSSSISGNESLNVWVQVKIRHEKVFLKEDDIFPEKSEHLIDPFSIWHHIHSACDYNSRVSVALFIDSEADAVFLSESLDIWRSEPVKALVIDEALLSSSNFINSSVFRCILATFLPFKTQIIVAQSDSALTMDLDHEN